MDCWRKMLITKWAFGPHWCVFHDNFGWGLFMQIVIYTISWWIKTIASLVNGMHLKCFKLTSFSDCLASVVCPFICLSFCKLFTFSSTGPISTKLGTKHPWMMEIFKFVQMNFNYQTGDNGCFPFQINIMI